MLAQITINISHRMLNIYKRSHTIYLSWCKILTYNADTVAPL